MDKTPEWCNSFILAPKVNGKVRLHLDPARFNKALIRPVHRDPTLNDTILRLAGIKYFTLIHAGSGYHILKLDERPSYSTTFLFHLAGPDI